MYAINSPIDAGAGHNLDAMRAAESVIIDTLLQTMDARGHVEMLPGLPGSKRPDEEVMLIGFPF